MSNLISTSDLAKLIGQYDVIILDASWHLPSAKRDAKAEFTRAHIPGARFFDIDMISDRSSTLPHMLPSAEQFQQQVRALGVSDNSKIIAYDAAGLFSAARCWWMFKGFGHDQVFVLDGGLPRWRVEKRALESGLPLAASAGDFVARFHPEMLATMDDVATGNHQIADARSPTRFRGEEPEPRPGVKPGHIPGAKNLHYASLLNSDGTMKTTDAIRARFKDSGIDIAKPVTTSCGSGVTAAILTLALTELGVKNHKLYDGSWAEWGASGREVVMG